jgi:hypothetical protein
MNINDREVREDIGMVKSDIMALGEEKVYKDIENIPLAEARLYFREIFNIALAELGEEEDDE